MENEPIKINAPASKSVSHRAVIAASLAEGRSNVSGILESNDLEVTRGVLKAAGAEISGESGAYEIMGTAGRPKGGRENPVHADMRESGTSCRLLTAVLAAGHGKFKVFGEGRMHERPIGELALALERWGTKFHWLEKRGYPPFVMDARGIAGGETNISLNESSQYLSGLLLAAPMAENTAIVAVGGEKVVSWPYVALTLMVMQDFGVKFQVQTCTNNGFADTPWRDVTRVEPGRVRFIVQPGVYTSRDYAVEGDWSNASYFLAAGAIGPRPVQVTGLRRDSLQGDVAILDILAQMGAKVSWNNHGVLVSPGELSGVDLDMGASPDLVPTVAVTAAMAKGRTRITNVAHLRIKESDRLSAVGSQLTKAGCRVELLDDGIEIHPAPLVTGKTISMETFGDHRIAMSLSLLGLAGVKPDLDNPGCVAKSFPGFWTEWDKIITAN